MTVANEQDPEVEDPHAGLVDDVPDLLAEELDPDEQDLQRWARKQDLKYERSQDC